MPDRSSPHSALLRDIEDYLHLRGAWTLRILGGVGTRRGSPDLLACCGGRCIAIEAKTGAATQSAVQRRQQEALEAAGGIYLLVRGLDQLEDALVDAGLVRGRVLRPLRKREG